MSERVVADKFGVGVAGALDRRMPDSLPRLQNPLLHGMNVYAAGLSE